MTDPLKKLSAEERKLLNRIAMPAWTAPMLATLHDKAFSSPDWIYERKLDGERCLVFGRGSSVSLMSRNQKRLNNIYPELVDALEGQSRRRFIADGEVVAFDGDTTSFSRLQQRLGIEHPDEALRKRVKVYLYLFDLIYFDGMDLSHLPLRTRKEVLRGALTFDDPLRFSTHRNAEGETFLAEACEKGWEGLIAKRADSAYVHSRSRDWLKLKCVNRQELVIGGYTDPHGSRQAFGALLLGYYEGEALRYAGRVGTGFDDQTLQRLGRQLASHERKQSPFDDEVDEHGVHWVSPTLVAEVGFTEWTRDGRLRHPRFIGLREDKPAREVVREEQA